MKKKIVCTSLLCLIVLSNVMTSFAMVSDELLEGMETQVVEDDNEVTDVSSDDEIKQDENLKTEVNDKENVKQDEDLNTGLKNEDVMIEEKAEQGQNLDLEVKTEDVVTEYVTEESNTVVESVPVVQSVLLEDGLTEVDGAWRVIVNGEVDYDYDGLAENDNGLWYVKDGTILFDYTGIYTNDVTGDSYVVERNRVTEGSGLVPLKGGSEWYLIKDSKIVKDYNDLYENGSGLWYVKEGKILFDYNDSLYKDDKVYIIEENKVYASVPKNATLMLEINGKWRMVQDGRVNYDYDGIAKNENGTWYFYQGSLTFGFDGIYTDEKTGDMYVIQKNRVFEGTDLVPLNGGSEWYLVQNGKVAKNYTDLYENSSGLWFVKDGKILFDYNDSLYKGDKAYIIEKNKVCTIVGEHATLMLEINGKWRMVQNGLVNYDYDGIAKNENGTWYFHQGNLDFKFTGIYTDEKTGDMYVIQKNRVFEGTDLVPLNGGSEWYLVQNGKVAKSYTDLYENGSGLWFVKDGKILFDFNVTLYKGDKAYIIERNRVYAVVDEHATEMLEVNGKWRMVQNGLVNYDYDGIAKNENGTWYFHQGELDFKFTGIYTDEATGDAYVIEKNRVVEGNDLIPLNGGAEWLLVQNGKFAKDYSDLYEFDSAVWYVKEGKIVFDFNDSIYKDGKAYIIERNRVYAVVDEHATEMLEVNGKWRMVQDGKVNYEYDGLAENENGVWYFHQGELNFDFDGTYTVSDGITYAIEGNRVVGIYSIPGYSSNMKIERPAKSNKYVSDMLSVSGWALSTGKDDKILIYVDGKLIGEATREAREDVFEEFCNNEFGGIECTPMPGFYFDLSTAKLGVGKHIITVKNIASDGETVIQSRDVEFYVMALTRTLGIDVSHYQGEIDWDAVKNSGVTFAILKIGEYWTNSKKIIFDEYFERNYWACKRLGIAVGGYFYSYAFNRAEGNEEADVCLSLIKDKRFELPIFLDVEDKAIKNAVANGKTDKANVTDASLAFCEKMVSAGHQGGIYASRNFFYDYFDIPLLEKYWIWVAHYTSADQTDYNRKYNFWQYTSDGIINGINGRVDLDWFYQK